MFSMNKSATTKQTIITRVDTKVLKALRAVVCHGTNRALDELAALRGKHAADQAKLKEAKAAAPALFAKKGDIFGVFFEQSVTTWEFLGRTSDGNLKFRCCHRLGTDIGEREFNDICDNMTVWPVCDFCSTERNSYDDGQVIDWRILTLPPAKCGGFRDDLL